MKKSSFGYYSHICFKTPIASIFFLLSVIVFSCTSALYIPSAANETTNARISDLQEGRKLYIHKCGSCHTLLLPEKYSKQEWQIWIGKMQVKALLNDHEKEEIFLYVTKGL